MKRSLMFAGTLAFLFGIAIGFLQVYPVVRLPWMEFQMMPLLVALIGMLLIGLICGVMTSLILRGSNLVMRFLVAGTAMSFGWLASEMTQGILRGTSLSSSGTMPNDFLTIGQISMGIIGVMLGIHVWQRRAVTPAPTPVRQQPAMASQQPSRRLSLPVLGTAVGQWLGSHIPSRQQQAVRSTTNTGRVKITSPNNARQRPRWRLLPRRQNVHLGKEVTSVCPYCLEEVQPGDPRGRVVCDICGTPHHADCWEVAGKCQVPHLQR